MLYVSIHSAVDVSDTSNVRALSCLLRAVAGLRMILVDGSGAPAAPGVAGKMTLSWKSGSKKAMWDGESLKIPAFSVSCLLLHGLSFIWLYHSCRGAAEQQHAGTWQAALACCILLACRHPMLWGKRQRMSGCASLPQTTALESWKLECSCTWCLLSPPPGSSSGFSACSSLAADWGGCSLSGMPLGSPSGQPTAGCTELAGCPGLALLLVMCALPAASLSCALQLGRPADKPACWGAGGGAVRGDVCPGGGILGRFWQQVQ